LFRPLHGTPKRHSVEKKVDGGFHFLTGPAGHPHRSLGRSRLLPGTCWFSRNSHATGMMRASSSTGL